MLCVLVLAVAACGGDEPVERPETPPAATTVAPPPSPAPDPDHSIRPDGIGRATAGITLGELRARLAPGQRRGEPEPFMVDLDGLPVVAGADTLYRVLVAIVLVSLRRP